MKKSFLFILDLFIILFAANTISLGIGHGAPNVPDLIPEQSSEKTGPEEALSLLIGEWIIDPVNNLKPGELSIKDKKLYSMTRWDKTNTGATITGGYKFDVSQTIYAIDLCLGECGQPGSEWTTQIGILRFISRDKMEIQFSPDGIRPSQFTPKDDDYYFLRLTRKKT